MKEKPLVLVTTPHTPKTLAKFVSELRRKVRAMDEEDQDKFFSLGVAREELCTPDRGDTRMMGLFLTNSVPVREFDKIKGPELGSAVYPLSSLLNHSCRPSTVSSMVQGTGLREVRAARDIKRGEQLTVMYGVSGQEREERVRALASRYNFQCDCEVCSLTGEHLVENDKLRREILGLNNNMEDVYQQNPPKAFKYAKMKLERIEKIRSEMIDILPQAYMDCYELSLAQGEMEIGQIFAIKGKGLARLIRGDNSLWSKIN